MEFVGEGLNSCIIKKNKKYISKYGLKSTMKKEYEILKILPKNNDFYVNIEKVSLEKVSLEEQNEIFKLPLEYSFDTFFKKQYKDKKCLYKINMPYIKGQTLSSFIFNRHLTFEDYKKLILLFIELIFKIQNFNENGFYHNDLHMNNILYNSEKLMIIDFGNAEYNENNLNKRDKFFMNQNLSEIIKLGISKFNLNNGLLNLDYYDLYDTIKNL